MAKLPSKLLCRVYLLLVLVVATTLSPFPYSPLSLLLLLVTLFISLRPLYPEVHIAIFVAAIFLLPLVLEPLFYYLTYTALFSLTAVQIMAVITTIPVIYLLGCSLRQSAQNMILTPNITGRRMTTIPRALFISTLATLLVSLVINNPTLLFTSITLTLCLLALMARVLYALPRLPLDIPTIGKRIITGATADVSIYPQSKASISLHSMLSPVDPWVKITPQRFTLDRVRMELNLTITPPLAGSSHPQLQVSVIDPWGLIQVNQIVEPVELEVIPRARYAEWLAMSYLEQTASRIGMTTTLPPRTVLMPKRGTEYFDSRTYQPGDSPKNIDWKHTLKLNRLIIKEYIDTGAQTAVIAVNLSVTDAEEADKLAFNLITTALTLAREAVPTALAAYNNEKVVLTTVAVHPRETLKQALSLVKDITVIEFARRFLQPPDIIRLRRTITLLKQATSEPAQRLLRMLNFEYQAIEEAAKNHPATLALTLATEHTPPPAIVMLVTQSNHDVEALQVTAEKLSKRGFTTMPMGAAKQQIERTIRSRRRKILAGYH